MALDPSQPEDSTEPKTEDSTEPKTEDSTEPKTEDSTEPKTEDSTEPKTEDSTEPKTEDSTEPKTESLVPSDDAEETEAGGKMSFLDHLDELRKRLTVALVALVVGVLICFGFVGYIFEFIMEPLTDVLPDGGTLVFTEPAEAFFLNIKMAALAGLMLAIPVILYQVWLFVAPGLYVHEKKFAVPFVLLASLFFIGGSLFAHYLLFPIAWNFFASFSSGILAFMPRIQPAFTLYVRLVLACGFVFQLPTIVFFLARVGAVTPGFLIRNIKYAILGIFIFAAVLTPTGDPVTLSMMAAPMFVLYCLSIGIAWVFAKRNSDV